MTAAATVPPDPRSTASMPGAGPRRPLRIAYLMSRFPKATETFILYEILELGRLGHHVSIHPLVVERATIVQPGAERLMLRVVPFHPGSWAVLRSQLHWLRRRPRAYLGAWLAATRGTLRSPKFLARSLVVVPFGAHVARTIERAGIDHIHAHWATHPALGALVAARLTGRPYTFTAHAHDIFVDRSMLEQKIREAAFVVTISDYNRRYLRELVGPIVDERVTVIHCGADPSVFSASPSPADAGPRADDRGPRGPLRLLVVASLQPQKGHRIMLDAMALLRSRGIEATARFVGEGEERPALEAAIGRLDLRDRVALVGAVPRDRVASELADADVVVQPSIVLPSGKTEGIPVALMEALAAQRAVVASDLSGIPELVRDGETGLLVAPGDAPALADALGRLDADPALRKRLGLAGRQLVLAEFDLRVNAAQLAARIEALHRRD